MRFRPLSVLLFLLPIAFLTPTMGMEIISEKEDPTTPLSPQYLDNPESITIEDGSDHKVDELTETSDERQIFFSQDPQLPFDLSPEYVADLQNPQSKAALELNEKISRYMETGATAIHGLGYLGMFLYYLNNPGQTPVSKLNQEALLLGTLALSVVSGARWINWGNYQKNPPSNIREYFRSYDPLNLKKLLILEITTLTLVMMLPLCIDSFGISTGYFVTTIIFMSLFSAADGYFIKNYFCNKPLDTL